MDTSFAFPDNIRSARRRRRSRTRANRKRRSECRLKCRAKFARERACRERAKAGCHARSADDPIQLSRGAGRRPAPPLGRPRRRDPWRGASRRRRAVLDDGPRSATHYVARQISRGPIVRAVTTSGTVNPVITVQIGTYVSGVIEARFCDYNTRVKKGADLRQGRSPPLSSRRRSGQGQSGRRAGATGQGSGQSRLCEAGLWTATRSSA